MKIKNCFKAMFFGLLMFAFSVTAFGQVQIGACNKACNDNYKTCIDRGLYTVEACRQQLNTCLDKCSSTGPLPEDPPESILDGFWDYDFSQMWRSFGIAKTQSDEGCKQSNFYQFS